MRKSFLVSAAALLCALFAGGTAAADVFYTTENGTAGTLGTIVIRSAESIDSPVTVVSGLGTSLDVSAFGVDGGTRVLLTHRSADSNDTAAVYTPGTWTSSTDCVLTGTTNLHGATNSGNGRSLYTASWGNGSIVEYATSTFTATGNKYTYTPSNGTARGVDVLSGSSVFGLFSVQSGDTGLASRVVWMDGQISDKVQGFGGTDASPNASEMTFLSDGRIAIAYLGNGGKGGIDLLNRGAVSSLISADVSGDQYGEVPTLCSDGDNGLYFVSHNVSNDVTTNALYRWKQDNTFTAISGDLGSGSFFRLAWDDSNKLVVLAASNRIAIFRVEDEEVKQLRSFEITRPVTSMALTAAAGSSDSSSSSGCSALAAGSLVLLLLPLTALGRRKR
ncbi:MAG: hypothetical protein K6E38_04355 [Fretibacterium sp.]|nr:hypothetical protein [Fretibacterium sp.]